MPDVLGILGSPRKGGNSEALLDRALEAARDAGAAVEKIYLCDLDVRGCLDCEACNPDGICQRDDDMQDLYPKILEAGAVLCATPIYYYHATGQMKCFVDRWCAFHDSTWNLQAHLAERLRGKRIGVLTVHGDPDPHAADAAIGMWSRYSEFAGFDFIGFADGVAADPGDIEKDTQTMHRAYELGRLAAGK